MKVTDTRPGLRVKVENLDWGAEIGPVALRHLLAREVAVTGTLKHGVNNHQDKVWWVVHDETGAVGVYVIHELIVLEDQRAPLETLGSPLVENIFD